ncbi:MAG: hypothetical protein SF029_00055 [bacterium]|nr:hypothetical protein [bacterium]
MRRLSLFLLGLILAVLLTPGVHAQPTTDLSARLYPDTDLVIRRADGGIDLLDAQFNLIYRSDFDPPTVSPIRLSQTAVYFRPLAADPSVMVALSRSGELREITIPSLENDGQTFPLDMLPTADGRRLAWLFSVSTDVRFDTPGAQNAEECGRGFSCADRDYTLVLTDGNGQNPETVWETRLEDRNGGVYYLLNRWTVNHESIILTLFNSIPSQYYPTEANQLLELSLSDNELHELPGGGDGIVTRSTDDGWIAWNYPASNAWVRVESFNRQADSITVYEDPRGEIFQAVGELTFSPDSARLIYPALEEHPTSFQVFESGGVRSIDLSNGTITTAHEFEAPLYTDCLPLLGPWLSESVIVVQHNMEQYALAVDTGDTFPLDFLGDDRIEGVITPVFNDTSHDVQVCDFVESVG